MNVREEDGLGTASAHVMPFTPWICNLTIGVPGPISLNDFGCRADGYLCAGNSYAGRSDQLAGGVRLNGWPGVFSQYSCREDLRNGSLRATVSSSAGQMVRIWWAHLVSTTKLQAVADERNAAFTRQNAWKRHGRAICPGLVILPRKSSVPAVAVLTRCAL